MSLPYTLHIKYVPKNSSRSQGVKDTTKRPTETTNLAPWGLTETQSQGKKRQVLELGPLHICSRCSDWYSYSPLPIRMVAVSDSVV